MATNSLSSREIEVLKSVAEGDTAERTAIKLGIALQTAKQHRCNIYRKLNAACAAHAVAIGFRYNILK